MGGVRAPAVAASGRGDENCWLLGPLPLLDILPDDRGFTLPLGPLALRTLCPPVQLASHHPYMEYRHRHTNFPLLPSHPLVRPLLHLSNSSGRGRARMLYVSDAIIFAGKPHNERVIPAR